MDIDKQTIRKHMKQMLKKITMDELELSSMEITKQIVTTSEWSIAKIIGITLPIGKEIDTKHLIETAWEQQKKIVVPKTDPTNKMMDFYEINDYSQVEESYYGIREPIISMTNKVEISRIDVMIIPCLAFDEQGFRIGYGGGYYDRYLRSFKGVTFGVALECQKVNKVSVNEFDIPLQKIVTEKKMYT